MAFGWTASCELELDLLEGRRPARDAVTYALDLLGWRYDVIDPDHYRARIPMNASSWGEEFTVSLEPGSIFIRSVCRYPLQIFDWGKNKRNVDAFLVHFSQKELRDSKIPAETPTYLDEAGKTPLERILLDDPIIERRR